MTKEAERQRLHKAVTALCLQAGTDTSETVDWLCGHDEVIVDRIADGWELVPIEPTPEMREWVTPGVLLAVYV